LIILAFCVVVQVFLAQFGGYFGVGFAKSSGLSWLEWMVSIVLGSLSIPVGFIMRVIPVPKRFFCGINIDAPLFRWLSVSYWFSKLRRRSATAAQVSQIGGFDELNEIN
jgi:hypothetical protein